MGTDIDLVKCDNKREAGLVEYGARVEHVGHERGRTACTRRVDDVNKHCRKHRSEGLCDDRATCAPSEDLYLARRVYKDVPKSARTAVKT